MRRIITLWHLLLMVVIAVSMTVYWGILLYFGTGPFFYRYIRLGPIAYTTDILALCTAVLVPAFVFSLCYSVRAISRNQKRFSWWAGLPFVSNWYALQATILLVLVVMFGASWSSLLSTDWTAAFERLARSSDTPAVPSDEQLEYPVLPLPPHNPYGWSIYDMEGNEVVMDSFKGKVVFLNFWATWCGYCLLEFPNIQRLQSEFSDYPNIAFVLVSPEEPEIVRKWVEEQEYTMPFYSIPRETLPAAYMPSGLPTTFILSADGRVAFRHSGFVAWDGEKTKRFLRELSDTVVAEEGDSAADASRETLMNPPGADNTPLEPVL